MMDTIQHHPEIALVIATLEISMIHEYEWLAPVSQGDQIVDVIEPVIDRQRAGLLHRITNGES